MLKDPDEILPYTVDWTAWLAAEDDTASAATWIVPDGITESADPRHTRSLAEGKATLWLAGGTTGTDYLVTSRLTTSGGRVADRTIRIQVRDR